MQRFINQIYAGLDELFVINYTEHWVWWDVVALRLTSQKVNYNNGEVCVNWLNIQQQQGRRQKLRNRLSLSLLVQNKNRGNLIICQIHFKCNFYETNRKRIMVNCLFSLKIKVLFSLDDLSHTTVLAARTRFVQFCQGLKFGFRSHVSTQM